MPLKIVHFALWNHGGAGIAAMRLHEGLRRIGVESAMYVLSKRGEDSAVRLVPSSMGEPVKSGSESASPALHKGLRRWQAIKARHPNYSACMEAFTDLHADTRLAELPAFRDADVINLHWVSGLIDFEGDVQSLAGKPVVWTMHDMNPITGGCHYSGGCERYTAQCGGCPMLGSQVEQDISRHVWTRKKAAFDRLDLTCVTPSRWLGECAGRSSIWRGRQRHVIPYGLDTEIYRNHDPKALRGQLGIPESMFLILFGAESVANQRKGFTHTLKALETYRERHGAENVGLVIFGHCPDELATQLPFHVYRFGYVTRAEDMSRLYSLADVCILPSLEDNLPNVGIEALACGLPVVGFRIGGVPDIVAHGETGYLTESGNVEGLCDGLAWARAEKAVGKAVRLRCRTRALSMFNLQGQAQAYVQLYSEILAKRAVQA